MPRSFLSLAVFSAFTTLVHFAPADAETTLCTEITALPFSITAQGVYCLKNNLNVNLSADGSAAITINAGNVTIDFNGFRVNNQAPLATNQAFGVYAVNRSNITVRNGFIRGFHRGVYLIEVSPNGSSAHLVEGMKIADSSYVGIRVEGDRSVIRDNRVLATGGGSDSIAFGIVLKFADEGLVSDNIVSGVSETFENYGVYAENSILVKVTGNEISNVNGSTNDRAIGLLVTDHAIIARNRLLNVPGTGTGGIFDISGSENVGCLENEAAGFSATPFSGCDVPVDNVSYFN